jgi:hypothetical protein
MFSKLIYLFEWMQLQEQAQSKRQSNPPDFIALVLHTVQSKV